MVIIELENKDNASSSVTYTFDCDKPDTLTFKKDTGCDWLTIETVKGTGGAKDVIKITTPKANEGERRTCYVTPMVGDYLCSPNKFMVAQEGGSPPEPPEPGEKLCWRGTDNGTDYYADESDPTKIKKVSNPILLCGCAGDNKGDSIFVSDGLDYSKTGEEGTWNPLNTEGFTVGDGNWCKVQLTTTPLCCGQPSFNVSALSDFEGTETEHVRSVTFYFKAHTYPPDGKVPACAGDGNPCTYEGAGKELCESWEYEVRQCALGYCWCGEHSKDAEAKPCGECTNKYRDCTDPYYCGTTPTTCTLDVKGNASAHLNPIPAEGTGDGFVKVGTYETTCKGNWVLPPTPKEGGVDFVTAWEFRDDGGVYAKAGTNKGKAMSTKYNVTKGDANDDFIIDQAGSDSCNKEKAAFRINGETIGYERMSMYTVAVFTANCTDRAVVHYESGEKIVSDSDINSCTVKDGVIKCPVTKNETDSVRKGNYSVYICEERCDGFTITQNPLVFSINGNTSDFSYDVYGASYTTTYMIDNSKPAHFKITGSGGGDDAYCTINGILEGEIDTTGTHNVDIGFFENVSTREIVFTDNSDSSKQIKLTLNINPNF